MITIYDIAKAAGVSPTTVSRVINNYTDVSQKTREKVLMTMEVMNYIPSPSARSLSTKRSYLVGVLFSETLNIGIEHPFLAGVIENFKKKMEQVGYDTLFITTNLNNRELSYLQHCKYRQVDGVFIVTGDLSESKMVELVESNIKCVTTDLIYHKTPRIFSDNASGSEKVVDYFFSQGIETIGYISAPLSIKAAQERYVGFIQAHQKYNRAYDLYYFEETYDFCYEAGYMAAKKMYERLGKNHFPKALYIAGDTMAIGAMKYFKEIGMKIPEELMIIGFDNIEISQHTSPALSTVAQDRKAIGYAVAETLLNLIESEEVMFETILPVELILRETTKSD